MQELGVLVEVEVEVEGVRQQLWVETALPPCSRRVLLGLWST